MRGEFSRSLLRAAALVVVLAAVVATDRTASASSYTIVPGGPSVTVTTTTSGENARATFPGTTGQDISLKISGVTMSSAAVSIIKPDGTNLLAPSSFGTSGKFVDTKNLPANGTYTILIDPTNAVVGSATLTLYDVPADVTSSMTPGGAAVTLTTTVPGQNAKATFAGTSGQRVSLKVAPTCCSLKVSIQKPDGTNLVSATSITASGGFIDTKTLPVNGTYTIVVNPQSSALGATTLALYDVPADVTSSMTPGGAAVTLTTTVPGQNAKVTFTGVGGRGIALKLDNVSFGATGTFQVSIKKPDGTDLVAAQSFGVSGGFIDTKTLPVNGTYTILLNPQGAAAGSVTLTLYDVPPQLTGTITAGGAPVSLNLASVYQNGRVTFSGTAGERISLRMAFAPTACCTVNVSINKPNGQRLVAPVGVASGESLIDGTTLPVTGTYAIVVDPYQTATGTVTLTLFDLPPDATASATVGGAPVTVTTTASGQNARVTFSGTAGDGIIVKLGPGNCCTVAASVLKPDGTTLVPATTFGTVGGSIYTRLTVTGTYTVLIDYITAAAGSVTVQVLRDNTSPTLSLGLASTTADGFAQGTTFFYRPAGTGSVNVTATTSDPGSGINRVVFPGLSGSFTPTSATNDFSSPYLQTYSWSGTGTLNNASNTVTAYDNIGNTSTATFRVAPDSAAPTTTDNTAAIGNAWKNTNQTVVLTPTDGSGSGVAATYHTTNGSTPTTTSPTGTSFTLSADGTYTVKYFSVDNVTNAEAVKTAGTVIRIDKTAPTVTMTAPPANIHNGQALTATASDALSGVASVSYYYCLGTSCTPTTLIGTSSTGPSYSVTWSAMPADGQYQLLARATDVAGNSTDSAKRSVTIDNAAPIAPTITASPANPTNSTAPSFSFTGEAGATFACSLDGAAFAACTSPKSYTGLSAASHTFQVRQTDAAGNTGPNAGYTWTIDTTPPAAPAITANPTALTNSTSASFSFTGEAGATFQCQLDGAAFAACTSPKNYGGLSEASHTFHVRQTDTAGNTGPSATFTWTIDTTAPETTIDTAPSDPSSPDVSFGFSSSEGGSTFECELDGGAFSACSSPQAYTGLSPGSHTFTVRATDAVGNTDPTPVSFSWTVS